LNEKSEYMIVLASHSRLAVSGSLG
jgi:hypothetical protein